MRSLTAVVLAACVLAQVFSAPTQEEPKVRRNMIRGRPRGGMKKTPPMSTVSHLINFDSVVSSTFTQTLDHFDSSVGKTFKQRYWHNNQWYKDGGPAFLMLGGEGPESSYWVSYPGLEITNLAAKQGAWVFDIEHRFYGETKPTSDMSVPNLKYLSSAQAIEDAAAFIKAMTAQYPQLANAKWVTFGGSYSGALAAWTRAKHPELVYAAVGSSGPVQAEVDFKEYLEVVQNSITRNSTACAASVTAGFNLVASLLQSADGRKQLKTAFHLCQDIKLDDKSLKYFWETVYSPYMEVVQYSGDAAGAFATQLTIPHAICRYHLNPSTTTIQKMKQVNDYFNLVSDYFGCNDIDYNGFISFMKDETFGEAQSDRAWVWQTCTEFGYYQSTASATAGPWFGGVANLPAQYYIDECTAIYGAAYNSQEVQTSVDYTNEYYGGRDNLTTARILLPNGDIDPWHALGKLTSSSSDIVPVVINGTAHCADMYGASSLDSVYLTNARQRISDVLDGWLKA
uniref:Serine protease K12H4.7 n=1 Tax=Caenorhabditis tropicalis TaxID=1561998 RepID=A0A1I7URH4_9PELO